MPLEIRGVEGERLAQALADFPDHIAGHRIARLLSESLFLFGGQDKRLLFPRVQSAAETPLLLIHALVELAAGAGELLRIGRIEVFTQFFQIQADVVRRPVLRQHRSIPVQDFATHGRNTHRAKGLHFEVRLVITR